MGPAEVESFLNYLATERHVAASTQSQALNAVVFLYGEVLGHERLLSDENLKVRSWPAE